MTEPSVIEATVEQYEKHGWKLRRGTLSIDSLANCRSDLFAKYPGVSFMTGPDEFLWFSRRSLPDREAWELRRLTGSPFALVAVLEDSLTEDECKDILSETERRMFDGSHPEPTSH